LWLSYLGMTTHSSKPVQEWCHHSNPTNLTNPGNLSKTTLMEPFIELSPCYRYCSVCISCSNVFSCVITCSGTLVSLFLSLCSVCAGWCVCFVCSCVWSCSHGYVYRVWNDVFQSLVACSSVGSLLSCIMVTVVDEFLRWCFTCTYSINYTGVSHTHIHAMGRYTLSQHVNIELGTHGVDPGMVFCKLVMHLVHIANIYEKHVSRWVSILEALLVRTPYCYGSYHMIP